MNFRYLRVNRQRKCIICGKPDWCSYTPDGSISFCARIITNADRVSRTGWGVFYHEKSLFGETTLHFPSSPPPRKFELAPIEIRDFVYRKLIALSPSTESNEIINGQQGLRARKILNFENYGSLPQSRAEREIIAQQIRALINREFHEFVRKQKSSVAGLPGFWLDKTGKIQLWTEKDYSRPMMLIPYRSAGGLIQACQIRFMSSPSSIYKNRYVWLSINHKNGGVSCGSPLHFASYTNQLKKPILVTEGALKAETIKAICQEYDVLANAGVTCSHEEIVTVTRFRPILIAFDTDYFENIHVIRGYARLLNSIIEDSLTLNIPAQIKILSWNPTYKGLDDALLNNIQIAHLAISEWSDTLNDVLRNEFLFCFNFHKILI